MQYSVRIRSSISVHLWLILKPCSSNRSIGFELIYRLNSCGKRAMRKDNFAGYLMISPWLISFFAFTLIPIVVSFYLAFTDYDILSPPTWVGTENFERMFTSDARICVRSRRPSSMSFWRCRCGSPLRSLWPCC